VGCTAGPGTDAREEIASFLGLRLETVSRSLSKLHDRGLMDAHE
jgi:CRP-like cAMP-binding protein